MKYTEIEAYAKSLGFAQIGACSTELFQVQRNTVNEQPALKERHQLRFDAQSEYPWATTLLVLLWPYEQAQLTRESHGVFVDSYYAASNQAYQAGRRLEEMLCKSGYKAKANVPYPAKAAAVRAGLGLIGDHGLLITPEYGTRVVIILLATDAIAFVKKDKQSVSECMHCGECAKACPTGAIDGSGMTHPERCLRNEMMEGVIVPEEKRKLMGTKMIGCDICQRVCPMQRGAESNQAQGFTLDDFMTTEDQAFKESVLRLGNLIGKNAARPQRVRAQAALIAGNCKREKDLSVLQVWENAEFDAVREHAKWAVKQIERHMQGIDQSDETR